jgi:hypothetical protein
MMLKLVRDPIGWEEMKKTTKTSIMLADIIADIWFSGQYGCFL